MNTLITPVETFMGRELRVLNKNMSLSFRIDLTCDQHNSMKAYQGH